MIKRNEISFINKNCIFTTFYTNKTKRTLQRLTIKVNEKKKQESRLHRKIT